MGEPNESEPPHNTFSMGHKHVLCVCDECAEGRQPPPPVTDEMRAKWAAMGLEVTRTPKPISRKAWKKQMDALPRSGPRW